MTLSTNDIQPGWVVVDANGDDLGMVVEANGEQIKVKKGGLRGGEVIVPVNVVAEVETGHVELSVAKADLG